MWRCKEQAFIGRYIGYIASGLEPSVPEARDREWRMDGKRLDKSVSAEPEASDPPE